MEKFGKGQPVSRIEDARFLTGKGRYVDDIAPKGALHAYVLRASVAHAEITSLDVTAARSAPGVHMVLVSQDLLDAGITRGIPAQTLTNRDGTSAARTRRPLLAESRIRFVGEPLALIVADSLLQARDAAELVELDYDELPAQMQLAPGEVALHPEAPDNRAFDWAMGDEARVAAALDEAEHVVELDVSDNRIIVNSMEPRGAYAEWDGERLHVAINGQGVWGPKELLSKILGLAPEAVRVTNPDTGGGFGMKGMMYPEYFLIAHAAMALHRPVRWMSDRSEAMQSDNAGRDLVHRVRMGLDADNRITAYHVATRCNLGAYCSEVAQAIQTELFAKVMMGTYDVQAGFLEVQGYFTNTTQVDAYRGAGRPEAIYLLERTMDHAARALGVDPWELRRRNFIAPDAFPYTTAMDITYDVGDFRRVLARAEQVADRAGFATRAKASEARGRLRGIGLCYYIESILGDPTEAARIEFGTDDRVAIYVGTQSNGQGHETVYARFLSDQTGIPVERIEVVQGDSDRIRTGGGTGGSRSVTVQNNATLETVTRMLDAFRAYLAEEAGVAPEDIGFDDERFRVPGTNATPTVLEVASMLRIAGRDDLLVHEHTATLPGRSFPNGAHVAEVEIDPETGRTTLERYSVVDDFGNMINPMLVEGQVHGGVAQGVGQALMERVVYDDDGQLLTASFMDYTMPRADDLPMFAFATEPVPSTLNVMGMKGCGEAGTVGSMAALANAVADALWRRGVRQADMPFTPQRVWEMVHAPAAATR